MHPSQITYQRHYIHSQFSVIQCNPALSESNYGLNKQGTDWIKEEQKGIEK